MTTIIGITGGIGSGKTTVANYYKSIGIPVYTADERAKNLYLQPTVLQKIIDLFGKKVVDENYKLDKKELSKIVFTCPSELQKLNNLIHPLVQQDFEQWLDCHKNEEILIKESALLFETGANKNCKYTINDTAPKAIKISRVMQRDNTSKIEILNRMKSQISDKQKITKSDFVIHNLSIDQTIRRANLILDTIKNLKKTV